MFHSLGFESFDGYRTTLDEKAMKRYVNMLKEKVNFELGKQKLIRTIYRERSMMQLYIYFVLVK